MAEFIELDAPQDLYGQYFREPWLAPPKKPTAAKQGDQTQMLFMSNGHLLSVQARWGLVQCWRQYGNAPHYYAGSESMAHDWTLSEAFSNRRCLIPATSFSYLRQMDGVTLRYRLRPARGQLMLLAGIFEPNAPDFIAPMATMALVTTRPNEALAPHGLAVPLLLHKKHLNTWLASASDLGELRALVKPCAKSALQLKITVEGNTDLTAERQFVLT